jgi:hypothetical protein
MSKLDDRKTMPQMAVTAAALMRSRANLLGGGSTGRLITVPGCGGIEGAALTTDLLALENAS